jgi:hypothetical protein
MTSPDKALAILTSMYSPVPKGGTRLVLKNFAQMTQVSDLSPGAEVTLKGSATYVSPIREADLDVHFDLASPGGNGFVVCEIQNADMVAHGQPLQQAVKNQSVVEVTGVLRIFPEHVFAAAGPTLAHIFEVHPIRTVKIGGTPLKNIMMDCPGKDQFTKQSSVHEISIQDDGSMVMASSGRRIHDDVQVVFDGTNLTMMNPPQLNVNYVWSSCYLSFDNSGSFKSGQPFEFQIRGSNNSGATSVDSVVTPGTDAYSKVRNYVSNPPGGPVTAALLRTLDIGQLMHNRYQVIFCPVYRFH